MKLINIDGLSFIGPGSEWFWSMLQFVVVAVTLYAIYRQLKIAGSANAFEQLNRIANEWTSSERIARNRLEILIALRDSPSPEDLPEGAAVSVADYWEGVAALVRAGHVDRHLVYSALGGSCRWWWAALAPFTRRARIKNADPAIGEHHEWLAGVMAAMDNKAGLHPLYDEAQFTSSLVARIQSQQDSVRVAEEMRAVIIRPMAPAGPPSPRPTADAVAMPARPAD